LSKNDIEQPTPRCGKQHLMAGPAKSNGISTQDPARFIDISALVAKSLASKVVWKTPVLKVENTLF
jgi:hypothetical protein|tara:strand:+ start:458 stop:655 length:198 start_codon:yes stop_codon:yes gene_type:complete